MNRVAIFSAIVALSLICVIADYFLKRAGHAPNIFTNKHFAYGVALYAASAFGWVYVLRHAKLATVGAVYSVVLVIGLALAGVFGFRETLSASEVVGLGCAVAALVLLGRFA